MEALPAMRLSTPRRYYSTASGNGNQDESLLSTPYTSAPSSPRRGFAFAKEIEETPLGEVRAAIPFIWESIPGTPRKDDDLSKMEGRIELPNQDGSDDSSDDDEHEHGSFSSSEFEFSARFVAEEETVEPMVLTLSPPHMSTAEELFSNGQLLPLRLPPRLQAVQHLRNSDSSSSSSDGSFRNYGNGNSMSPHHRRGVKKLTPLCGLMTKSPEGMGNGLEMHATTILGMQEDDVVDGKFDENNRRKNGKVHRSRSLSPLKLFKRDSVRDMFAEKFGGGSDTSSSSLSSSSCSSSSSSSGDKNADESIPKEFWPFLRDNHKRGGEGGTLSDFLFTDKKGARGNNATIGSPKIDLSRISNKELINRGGGGGGGGVKSPPSEGLKSLPRIVESRKELLKKQGESMATSKEIEKNVGRQMSLTPLLSRSNARSASRFVVFFDLFMSLVCFHLRVVVGSWSPIIFHWLFWIQNQ